MFIAALFTIAKTWQQPKCPSTEDWLNKMCGVCVCVFGVVYCVFVPVAEPVVCVYVLTFSSGSSIHTEYNARSHDNSHHNNITFIMCSFRRCFYPEEACREGF